jgi:hypothetical protein
MSFLEFENNDPINKKTIDNDISINIADQIYLLIWKRFRELSNQVFIINTFFYHISFINYFYSIYRKEIFINYLCPLLLYLYFLY